MSDIVWRPEDDPNIRPPIHCHRYAHDACTAFMEKHGFARARFGCQRFNAEMDALPGIGHGCGHNLIGISGVAVAFAANAAMERLNINGKTGDDGDSKRMLYGKGAYDEMDMCFMSHPTSGPRHSINLSSTLTISRITVEYQGHAAHSALSSWEGLNALDAAVLAYNNVSLLRQQIKPAHRVLGILGGKDWAPNIVPDNATMHTGGWSVLPHIRDGRYQEACIEAAALASGCKVQLTIGPTRNEIRQNKALGDELADVVLKRYGAIDSEWGMKNASSNFRYISYMMPSLRPNFAIPTIPNGGNHTPGFTEASRSEVSHNACLVASKALAAVGMRVLTDDVFFQKVKDTFEEDKRLRV